MKNENEIIYPAINQVIGSVRCLDIRVGHRPDPEDIYSLLSDSQYSFGCTCGHKFELWGYQIIGQVTCPECNPKHMGPVQTEAVRRRRGRPRSNEPKTQTPIYLSVRERERLGELADEANMSLAAYIMSLVRFVLGERL